MTDKIKIPMEIHMLLDKKIAVVYGAGGAIGGAVATVFAREGAKVHLAGRDPDKLREVAARVAAVGKGPEVTALDVFDENAVDRHLVNIVDQEGRVDVSFNSYGLDQTGVQGTPLLDLPVDAFMQPLTSYLTAQFVTTRAVARHMRTNRSGVLVSTVTAPPARLAAPLVGGMGPAWAAMEAFSRNLALELGPSGVRVVSLRAAGLPDTPTVQQVMRLHAAGMGLPVEQVQTMWEGQTMRGRLPQAHELAEVAAFLASDRAAAMTGTVANLTGGAVVD